MVNSKKMSKSSIAVIVLSILLVLSLILGFTGAWFTAKDAGSSNDSLFGKVAISTEGSKLTYDGDKTLATETKLMPGCSVKATVAIKNDTVASEGEGGIYYVVKIKISVNNETKQEGFFVKGETAAKKVESATDLVVLDNATSVTITAEEKLDGETYTNDFANKTVHIEYSVYAIQSAHIEATEAYKILVTNNASFPDNAPQA